MKAITEKQFHAPAHKITRGPRAFEEREWYEHEGLLGVICVCPVDSDFQAIILAKEKGSYRPCDIEVCFSDRDAAFAWISEKMKTIAARRAP